MSAPELRSWEVPVSALATRLDLHVGETLGLSRAKLKALFDLNKVQVNGRRAKKGDKVQPGQTVQVELTQESRDITPDPGFDLHILFEDSDVVVVDKPAGMPSHPLLPGEMGTVANALVARHPACAEASGDPREGGLCHRLDIDTSGVLLAARTRAAWTALRADFSGRRVDKRYWALVTGPLGDEGEIDLPLRHHPRHPDRVEPALDGTGREAVSRFRILSRAGEYSFVEVTILTGVLHQVRAHLAGIGAPLVGDTLYGGRLDEGLGRFFLHARALGFTQPSTQEVLNVVAPLPPELLASLARVGIEPP